MDSSFLILRFQPLFCISQAYKDRNTFILTQAPLPHTIEDFWQMISDYSIGSVVMLNNLSESGVVSRYGWHKMIYSLLVLK